MAVIKVLKEEELVGGNSDKSVYPVTTSKALYDIKNRVLQSLIDKYDANIENTSGLDSKHEELKRNFEKLKTAFEILLGSGDVTDVIDTFKEVEDFLSEYKNDSTLNSVIEGFLIPIKTTISSLAPLEISLDKTTGKLIASYNTDAYSVLSEDTRINPNSGEINIVFNF